MDDTCDLLVLDGGLSNALEDRGHDLSTDAWTARLLLDDPGEIAAVHRAYYEAGADVATTASYQATQDLLAVSVRIAREVRDEVAAETGRRLLVAASVGPYGALLADGSEYRGRYGVSAATLRDFHAPRLEALAAAGPDLLAVETVPDADEAEVLVRLLGDLGVPAWFSYAVAGDATRAGQPLAAAYDVLAGCDVLVAAGSTARRPATSPGRWRPRPPRPVCPASPTPTSASAGTTRPTAGRATASSTSTRRRPGWSRARGSWGAVAGSDPTGSPPSPLT